MELCSCGLSTTPNYQIFGLLYDVLQDKSSKNSHTLFTTACNIAGIESSLLKGHQRILFYSIRFIIPIVKNLLRKTFFERKINFEAFK